MPAAFIADSVCKYVFRGVEDRTVSMYRTNADTFSREPLLKFIVVKKLLNKTFIVQLFSLFFRVSDFLLVSCGLNRLFTVPPSQIRTNGLIQRI